MWEFIVGIITVVVVPVVINKSTESGHLDWIKQYLRPIWTGIFIIYAVYLLQKTSSMEATMELHKKINLPSPVVYLIVGLLGAVILCGYWWLTGKLFSENKPTIVKQPEQQIREEPNTISPKSDKHIPDIASNELIKTMTGGDSYCYMSFFPIDIFEGKARPSFYNPEKYPLYGVEAFIVEGTTDLVAAEIRKQGEATDGEGCDMFSSLFPQIILKIGDIAADGIWDNFSYWMPFDLSKDHYYSIQYRARNGIWNEVMSVLRTKNGWVSGSKVCLADIKGTSKRFHAHYDSGFLEELRRRGEISS